MDGADVAGAANVRAAAQFDRPRLVLPGAVGLRLAHRHDADFIAVFFAEERHRTRLDRIVVGHQPGLDRGVLGNDRVGDRLDRFELLRVDRLRVREVEAQPIGRDERTLLGDMVAQDFAQRLVDEVGRGVVGADGRAPVVVDDQFARLAGLEAAHRDFTDVHEDIAEVLLGVGDGEDGAAFAADLAPVADLAAALAVERRLVEDDRAGLAFFEPGGLRAVGDEGGDDAFGPLGFIAEEFRRADLLADVEPDALGGSLARAFPGGAGLGLLALHGGRERVGIDPDAAGAKRVLREVEGEAEGVVETEGGLARERVALAEAAAFIGEQAEAALEGLAEAGFLELQGFRDQRLTAAEFGIGFAHLPHEGGDEAVHQRLLGAEQVGVAHGAAHDPAQHVAAALVGREHAVGDQETGCTQVIGDDAVARLVRAFRLDAGLVD